MIGNTTTPYALPNPLDRPIQLLTRLEARAKLGGVSDDKFYSMIRAGDLPPPLKLGTSSRWLESDLDDFVLKLAEKRVATSAPAGIRRHHEKLSEERQRRGGGGLVETLLNPAAVPPQRTWVDQRCGDAPRRKTTARRGVRPEVLE